MQDYASLLGRVATAADTADRHRRAAYDRFFSLEPGAHALAFHWLLFTALPDETRSDGHPVAMAPFPPLDLPRRMWAGGEVAWHKPIAVGDALTRRSTITRAEAKQGASGEFLLASVEHEIASGNGLCVAERQDIVFLPAATRPGTAPPRPLAFAPDWSSPLTFGPVELFRYSALTLNSHRIHYDSAYAREAEHYAGLVVHGPLLASCLMHAGAEAFEARYPARFTYRAVAPSFAGEELRIVGHADGSRAELAVIGPDDDVRTTGTLVIEAQA